MAHDAVDAFLDQLDGSEEVWVTISSSSQWATKVPSRFLPPSPAKDPDAYYRFVQSLVKHCAGRVQFWQCDNEPSNVGLTWAGTAEEYVAQLKVMHRAVKDVTPDAIVVLGGATYALPSAPADSPERQFFDVLLREGRDHFDAFDVHLYQDAGHILDDIENARAMMRSFGYEKPLLVGEYNAPWPNLFPEAVSAMNDAFASAFASAEAAAAEDAAPDGTPEQRAMARLYERMADLPPQLQMFMRGCSADLEEKRSRINSREIVMRNLLALSAGIRRTVCWNLAPDIAGYEDPLSPMDLLFGKLALTRYEGRSLTIRHPAADAFARLAAELDGVETVTRMEAPGRPDVFVFDVWRGGRSSLLVAWVMRDPFRGEDEPPEILEWPWPHASARTLTALGVNGDLPVVGDRISLALSVTPIFVEVA